MKIVKLVCLLILTALGSVAFAAAENQADTQFVDPKKPILINPKAATFSIKLDSNPSTGYSWFYDADKSNSDLIVVDKQQYVAPTKKLIGTGGSEIWTFTVNDEAFNVPTVIKITLLYARAWDVTQTAEPLVLTIVTSK